MITESDVAKAFAKTRAKGDRASQLINVVLGWQVVTPKYEDVLDAANDDCAGRHCASITIVAPTGQEFDWRILHGRSVWLEYDSYSREYCRAFVRQLRFYGIEPYQISWITPENIMFSMCPAKFKGVRKISASEFQQLTEEDFNV